MYVDFATDKNLGPRNTNLALTFTRASSGTYFDNTGTLQTALTNAARFDHNPSTLASLGLSHREARTNVCLWNRDLTNAAWAAVTMTVAKDQTGIDGSANSASSLTATAGNGTCLQAITLASSARFQSAYVKRITGTGVVNMTLDNGATWIAVTVTAAWTRVTIPTQTLANPTVGFQIVTNADAIAVDYVQNENGTFETSPIATTTAAATRALDVCSTTDLSWFNASEGTFVVRFATRDISATAVNAFAMTDGTGNERISVQESGSGVPAIIVIDGGATQANTGASGVTMTADTFATLAGAYQVNNFAGSTNGGAIGTDTSGTLPTVTTLNVGGRNSQSAPLNGWISSLAYYPRRLPDATLQRLST